MRSHHNNTAHTCLQSPARFSTGEPIPSANQCIRKEPAPDCSFRQIITPAITCRRSKRTCEEAQTLPQPNTCHDVKPNSRKQYACFSFMSSCTLQRSFAHKNRMQRLLVSRWRQFAFYTTPLIIGHSVSAIQCVSNHRR